MNTVYLLFGSNIGDSKTTLLPAAKKIEQELGKIKRRSSLYKTAAWGYTDQPDFLNMVAEVHTSSNAQETLKCILSIEKEMGRVRTQKNAPRIIDIDILFFNNEIIRSENLTVPHPEIQNRRFVLVPLTELIPHYTHPVLNKTIKQLLESCADELNVQKI